ncbi:uncharacterized protein LOC124616473 [Schistocerca americana]|uniref:uncharacterized protein LOC124616473 n=1 Tax=Schistocerca americana TaxID=7009 RepID=UPI001F500FAD|nr:uncharacterized protein LOC124616473 [Schistocerca americana]
MGRSSYLAPGSPQIHLVTQIGIGSAALIGVLPYPIGPGAPRAIIIGLRAHVSLKKRASGPPPGARETPPLATRDWLPAATRPAVAVCPPCVSPPQSSWPVQWQNLCPRACPPSTCSRGNAASRPRPRRPSRACLPRPRALIHRGDASPLPHLLSVGVVAKTVKIRVKNREPVPVYQMEDPHDSDMEGSMSNNDEDASDPEEEGPLGSADPGGAMLHLNNGAGGGGGVT